LVGIAESIYGSASGCLAGWRADKGMGMKGGGRGMSYDSNVGGKGGKL
jgi:hypothetical protein